MLSKQISNAFYLIRLLFLCMVVILFFLVFSDFSHAAVKKNVQENDLAKKTEISETKEKKALTKEIKVKETDARENKIKKSDAGENKIKKSDVGENKIKKSDAGENKIKKSDAGENKIIKSEVSEAKVKKSAAVKNNTKKAEKIEDNKVKKLETSEETKIQKTEASKAAAKKTKITAITQKETDALINGSDSATKIEVHQNNTLNKANTLTKATDPLSDARSRFLQAETALKTGNNTQYQKLKQDLKTYPLYPYLLFTEYDRSLNSVEIDTLLSFLNQYPDSPLAEQLRIHWLQAKARKEDWAAFLKAYVPTQDLNLQCHQLWGRLITEPNKRAVLEDVVPIWLTGKETPKACQAVFQKFEESNLLTRPMIWQRIKLAIQEGNIRLAKQMAHYVEASEKALVELWIMVHKNPHLILQEKYFNREHPAVHEMIVHGVSQIAKTQPETAIQIWQQIGKRYTFAERHWGLVVRAIGLSFASMRHPDAEKWLSKVPNVYANQAVHEWRVRVSLSKQDWQSVAFWLKNFPENMAKEEIWQYWQARALDKINQRRESQEILSKLAQTRSFYGFLASQHLQKPYPIAQQKFPLDDFSLSNIAQKNCVKRARELYLLGREGKARAEWTTAASFMSDQERHAAAALALKWGLPNWSILALSKAHNKNDLSLRFPLVHIDHIHTAARHNQLDPAFIFAVTRQESAFVSNAKSSAGALGLMQLMPTTAKLVAKRHQIPLKNLTGLMDPATNIQLGSRYLRMMLNEYQNHPILATAAYNAGPGRIKRWLPSYDMEADSWIETIPFKETREYVKNVMTYTVIYRELLGNKANKPYKLPYIPGYNGESS